MQIPETTGGGGITEPYWYILNRTVLRRPRVDIRSKTLNPVASTCALAVLLVLHATTIAAQSISGSMFGSVLDSSGSAVQGAQLKLVHSATGAERAALTDARGEFAISALGPGQYSLTVEARGFKKPVRADIELTSSDPLS